MREGSAGIGKRRPALWLLAAWLLCGGSPWRSAALEPDAESARLHAGLAEQVARREYEATPNARGLQAPNRAHGLRTYFEPGGIRVHDRTAAGSPELIALTLSGVGRGEALAPVAAGEVTHDGARVEIRRPKLVEWYENSEAGLEQGFTLAERPPGSGELALELRLQLGRAELAGDRVTFAAATGRRLEYGKLAVRDAAGRLLPARFEVPDSGRVRLVADDTGARYPLVVDPLLSGLADSTRTSAQSEARLGASVASAGDWNRDGFDDVIVGAPLYDSGETDEGKAFLYTGGPAGIAVVPAATFESDQAGAELGTSVAGAGDVNGDGYGDVIVGAPGYDAPEDAEGAAFVFLGNGTFGATRNPGNADAQLESNVVHAQLGMRVAGPGDVNGDGYADVMVSAPLGFGGGAVFLFQGSASGIANGTPSTAATEIYGSEVGMQFGMGLAGAGDVNGDGYADVIVGAPAWGTPDEGAAFVFLGAAAGIADTVSAAAASRLESDQSTGIGAQLGASVAGAGDVNGDGYADVIVGAPAYDNGQTDEGAAFVFHGSASGIVANGNPGNANAMLEANQASADLGVSVAAAGDVNGDGYADVIVGADLYDNGTTDEGLVLVFRGGSGGIGNGSPFTAYASADSGELSAQLGHSVAGAGDVTGDGYADVIAGAWLWDGGTSNQGSFSVYHGGGTGILFGNPASAAATIESNQAGAMLGFAIANAGDVNGDGYDDLIVGAHLYDDGQTDEGAAFIFHGGPSGIASGSVSIAATKLESNQAGASFGYSVDGAGDVNGDGYADVIVGAQGYDAGQTDEGAFFVFHGSASGVPSGNPATANAVIEGNQAGANLGFDVAGAGDVNGDGYADVIAGAPFYDGPSVDEGRAFVYFGSAAGVIGGPPPHVIESDQASAQAGYSVDGAGDVNNDGYADVIVGIPYYDDPIPNEGAVLVFLGGPSGGVAVGNPGNASSRIESEQGSGVIGSTVAAAGDVNGDGYGDVITGASLYTNGGEFQEGAAFVFHGSSTGIVAAGSPANADARLESNQASAFLGAFVDGAGDVNGDGYDDVIVGANLYDQGQGDEGAAFVFYGGSSGIGNAGANGAAARLETNQAGAQLGGVAGIGDVNGDGFADVAVGSWLYDDPSSDEGAFFVFYGNGNTTGRRVIARQLRGGASTTPVQPWGRALHAHEFQVVVNATDPQGRGRAALVVEACPSGVSWGGPGCRFGTSMGGPPGPPVWTDVTASPGGVPVSSTVSGLTAAVLYHWRARVFRVPFSATQLGLVPIPPKWGPHRRLQGAAHGSFIRTDPDPDGDGDDDGLLDAYESNTGTYVSPTNTGTNALLPDSDGDGLLDGAEVALGTDPTDFDTDDDLVPDLPDNCPLIANGDQTNSDPFAAGDACQCGDVTGEGALTAADYQRAREHVAGRTPSGPFDVDRCDVTGDGLCDVADLAVLDRLSSGAPATLVDECVAFYP